MVLGGLPVARRPQRRRRRRVLQAGDELGEVEHAVAVAVKVPEEHLHLENAEAQAQVLQHLRKGSLAHDPRLGLHDQQHVPQRAQGLLRVPPNQLRLQPGHDAL
jgi:hypothetical protein